jgi:rhamnosyltransferase subunit B
MLCRNYNYRSLRGVAGHLPHPLPALVRHVHYAPFSQLLSRSAALVHHGGIGTAAHALKAGVRQLVAPCCYDQFDNAAHLRRLGVSRTVARDRYTPAHVATIFARSAHFEKGVSQAEPRR